MVGPCEGLSLVDRNRFGARCTHFSGRLRRRFRLEYRVHGLTHEFKCDAKRFLSLNLVGTSSRSSVFVFLMWLNLQLGIRNGTPDEQELVPTEEKRFPSVWSRNR